jgi:hypothetical protein
MRTGTQQLKDVIEGGAMKATLVGDVVRGAERLLEGVSFESWSLTGDYDADIKSGGDVTLLYAGDFADSVSPRELTDILAPYGSEIHLYMEIAAENFSGRIAMGKYRIDGVPSASDSSIVHRERLITAGSVVQLRLLDRMRNVQRAPFRSLEQPSSLTSTWAELGRVTRLPLTRNVNDVAIPSTLVYPRSRLETAQLLAQLLGGRPYLTEFGTVAILPDTAGSVVATIRTGPDGSIGELKYSMESEDVYNVVVGDFETADGTPIHVEAEITDGPLAVENYGENVAFYERPDKELITDTTTAQTAVNTELARVSQTGYYELPIQCRLNPLLEIGDVIQAETVNRLITGRIRKTEMNRSGPMSLTLAVISDVTN